MRSGIRGTPGQDLHRFERGISASEEKERERRYGTHRYAHITAQNTQRAKKKKSEREREEPRLAAGGGSQGSRRHGYELLQQLKMPRERRG